MPPVADPLARLYAALAGHYTIERELGRGGMATVYLGHDPKHDRPVAIKVLRPELAASVGAERFLREIQIAAHLQHPHILALHDSGEADGILYYVMPYIEGESLRAKLERDGALPIGEAVRILRDVADALAYAHAHDVVHRDIKPDNVLITGHHAVVTDFGVAKALSAATGEASLTSVGVALGTPAYMAPEQAAAEPHVDHRADIYALGAMAYEMLTGAPPFAGSVQSVLAAHVTQMPAPITERRAGVPPGLAALVMRCLAKKPADRWQGIAELHQQLDALVTPSGGTVPLTAAGTVGFSKRRWALAALAGVLVVIGGAVLARRSAAHVIASASSIAVMPFSHASSDSVLDRLGRDLVVTLSANLDGVGDIRTVDALTVLSQVPRGSETLSLEGARRLSRKVGAASVVYGTLVRVGSGVRLDFGLYTSDSGQVVARASIRSPIDSIQVLTDSATWALLHEVWRGGRAPAPSLDAATTRSVPALRAFLAGERFFLDGQLPAAESAFARAVTADSTFWWAYRRYAYMRGWQLKSVDSATRAAFVTHRSELPARERMLIEAGLEGGADTSFTAYLTNVRRVIERYPDDWPAWFEMADAVFHWGALIGNTREDAIAGFQRTLELNPRLAPGWEHLQWAAAERDPALELLAFDSSSRLAWWSSDSLAVRLGREYLRTHLWDQQLLDSVAKKYLPSMTSPIIAHEGGLWDFGPMISNSLNRQLLAVRPDLRKEHTFLTVLSENLASAGAWDAALAVLDSLRANEPERDLMIDAYRLAVVGAWLGAVDSGRAGRYRKPITLVENRLNRSQQAELLWLDGLLAFVRSDRACVKAARAALDRVDTAAVPVLRRSLAGFEMAMSNPSLAGREVARLEWDRPEIKEGGYSAFPYLLGVDRLAASTWLLAARDTDQAERLLRWSEGAYADVSRQRAASVTSGPSFLLRARIAEAQGQKTLATQHYRSFLRRFVLPDARLKHLRDEAEAALARLEGRPTTGPLERVP